MAPALFANAIETKDNKIMDLAPDGDRYDSYYSYLSGNSTYKTFDELNNSVESIYPIGSEVIMSTNTNPSTYFGGTWELVSKKFKHQWITPKSSDWTATKANFYACHIALYGDIVMIRLGVTPTELLTDSTVTLGTLNLANYDLAPLFYGKVEFKAHSDGGNSTHCLTISAAGKVECYDSLYYPGHSHSQAATGQTLYLMHYTHMKVADMPDKYCDRFYFKRTA